MNLNLIGKINTYEQLSQSTIKTCKQADIKWVKSTGHSILMANVIYMYFNVKDGHYRSEF